MHEAVKVQIPPFALSHDFMPCIPMFERVDNDTNTLELVFVQREDDKLGIELNAWYVHEHSSFSSKFSGPQFGNKQL